MYGSVWTQCVGTQHVGIPRDSLRYRYWGRWAHWWLRGIRHYWLRGSVVVAVLGPACLLGAYWHPGALCAWGPSSLLG